MTIFTRSAVGQVPVSTLHYNDHSPETQLWWCSDQNDGGSASFSCCDKAFCHRSLREQHLLKHIMQAHRKMEGPGGWGCGVGVWAFMFSCSIHSLTLSPHFSHLAFTSFRRSARSVLFLTEDKWTGGRGGRGRGGRRGEECQDRRRGEKGETARVESAVMPEHSVLVITYD